MIEAYLQDLGDQSYFEQYHAWLSLELLNGREVPVSERVTKLQRLLQEQIDSHRQPWRS